MMNFIIYIFRQVLLFVITFLQFMYLENQVCRVYNDAAVLWLQCVVHAILFIIISVLYCSSISNFLSAVRQMDIFCSYLMSCLPGTLFRYPPNDFKMVLFAPNKCWYSLSFQILHALHFHFKVFIV
jgi:hypothetical protein